MLLNFDQAKKVSSDLGQYNSNPLDLYTLVQKEKLSISEYLEKLDPSEKDENGNIVGIDALQRQLMVSECKLSGRNQVTVEQLADRVEYLMPEIILRTVKEGMNVAGKFSYSDLVADIVPAKSVHYHPLYIPNLNLATQKSRRDKSLGARSSAGQGGEFPVLSVRTREKDIVVNDYGRTIEATYSVIKDYGWSEFATLLRLIGAQLAADKLQDIYNLGISGDGTVGAATNTFAGAAGTLAYTDLIDCDTDFEAPFKMDAILAPQTSARTILAMSQFQDPQAGWTYQKNGEFVTPMGAKLKQVNSTPGSTPTGTVVVALDSKFAIKEVVNEELGVEAEKIITRKFESATISGKSSFCVIADGALRRIIWT